MLPPPPPPAAAATSAASGAEHQMLERPAGVTGNMRVLEQYRPREHVDKPPRFGGRSLKNKRLSWWFALRKEAKDAADLSGFLRRFPEPYPKALPWEPTEEAWG
jgi:hypothetical protein